MVDIPLDVGDVNLSQIFYGEQNNDLLEIGLQLSRFDYNHSDRTTNNSNGIQGVAL